MTQVVVPLTETRRKVYRKLRIIAGLSVLAMLVTLYLTYLHYSTGESFCDINSMLNCDAVNKSKWSEFLGIPVAILGFLTYLVLFFISIAIVTEYNFRNIYSKLSPKVMMKVLLFISFVGTGFSLYLTYIELFVLKTVCIMCVTQQIIILAIFLLTMGVLINVDQGEQERHICEFC